MLGRKICRGHRIADRLTEYQEKFTEKKNSCSSDNTPFSAHIFPSHRVSNLIISEFILEICVDSPNLVSIYGKRARRASIKIVWTGAVWRCIHIRASSTVMKLRVICVIRLGIICQSGDGCGCVALHAIWSRSLKQETQNSAPRFAIRPWRLAKHSIRLFEFHWFLTDWLADGRENVLWKYSHFRRLNMYPSFFFISRCI